MNDLLVEIQKEYLEKLKKDYNQWHVFREFLSALNIHDEAMQDVIQGFVAEMKSEKLKH